MIGHCSGEELVQNKPVFMCAYMFQLVLMNSEWVSGGSHLWEENSVHLQKWWRWMGEKQTTQIVERDTVNRLSSLRCICVMSKLQWFVVSCSKFNYLFSCLWVSLGQNCIAELLQWSCFMIWFRNKFKLEHW